MPDPLLPSGTASPLSRRHFIKYSAVTATVLGVAPAFVRGQNLNSRVQVASIGVGGKGSSDCDDAGGLGDMVALCDVDLNTLNKKGERFPKAEKFQDFRKMLEKMGKSIDAVTVSTPDHTHAPASVMAMRMGKHCFCQKPLTHGVHEARVMRNLAAEKKLATQMGNQGSANDGLRRSVEVIQAGVIGKPLELHVWSNRPIWPQGLARPAGEDAVPAHLDWDLWLGPAPFRPYKKDAYHAFKWRGIRDFGTGALGDMACHTVNMPFRALKLGYPTLIECEETSELFEDSYPKTSRIRFEFPAREGLPPLKFWWYDGSPNDKAVKALRPHTDITGEILDYVSAQKDKDGKPRPRILPSSGALVIGDKGRIYSTDDYGSSFFIMADGEKSFRPGSSHEACQAVPKTIPRSPGHMREWFDMMQKGTPAYSNFSIAAYLTEVILLGCVAMQVGVGKKMEWDGPNLRATNTREADRFVKRPYRAGWEPV